MCQHIKELSGNLENAGLIVKNNEDKEESNNG